MKSKKLISIALCAAALFCLLSACGGGSGSSGVRSDVAVGDISKAVSAVLSDDALVSVDGNYVSGSMKMDVSQYDSYDVKINSKGVNIDEFGIFKAKDASGGVKAVQKAVADYLQMRKDTWMKEYMPQEHPKLENAEVKTKGEYVMYAILSDSDKEAAFSAFEKSLASK